MSKKNRSHKGDKIELGGPECNNFVIHSIPQYGHPKFILISNFKTSQPSKISKKLV